MEPRYQTRPRTPKKVRSRRESFCIDEIPTRDTPSPIQVNVPPSQGYVRHDRRSSSCSRRERDCETRRSFPEATENTCRNFHRRGYSEGTMAEDGVLTDRAIRAQQLKRYLPISNRSGNSRIGNTSRKEDTTLELQGSDLFNDIYKLWKNRELCDVIIHADGMTFPTHRLVMAAVCENFQKESHSIDKLSVIDYTVPGVNADVMEAVVKYFYTSTIEVNQYNVAQLIAVSQQLGIAKIFDTCLVLLGKVNMNNALANMQIAQRYDLVDIVTKISSYVQENFTSVIKTEEFLQSDFNCVYALLSSDLQSELDQMVLFQACERWINFDIAARLRYAAALMGLVSFVDIHPCDIVADIEPVKYIFDIPECKQFLHDAYRHHACHNTISDQQLAVDYKQDNNSSLMTEPRNTNTATIRIQTSPRRSNNLPPYPGSPRKRVPVTSTPIIPRQGVSRTEPDFSRFSRRHPEPSPSRVHQHKATAQQQHSPHGSQRVGRKVSRHELATTADFTDSDDTPTD